jgi:serine/threonine protein kinase
MPKTPSPEPEELSSEASSRGKHFEGAHDDFGLTPRPREPRVKTQRVDPLLGMDLGGVKIIKLIGEGGMGRVYEARQEKPSRTVAVKIIRAGITSEKTMRRFEREAEFLGRLQHSGIAQIYVVGAYESDLGSVPFYVMEFLSDAKPITNYVHEKGLGLHEKLRLFKRVCEAVSHGHDRGIIHRDLKPGNILVDAQGTPKVIDFGVARSTDSDLTLESMKTDTGQLIGTIQYMSPEQFGPDPDDLDGRADVYSLGVVLYEILSGSAPYSVKKKALHEASRVVCEEIPAPLRSVNKSVPGDVSAICERCLQKDRSRRYYTAGELAADIGRFLDGQPVRARPGTLGVWYVTRRVAASRVGLVGLVAVLFLAALAALVLAGRNVSLMQPSGNPAPTPAMKTSPVSAQPPEQDVPPKTLPSTALQSTTAPTESSEPTPKVTPAPLIPASSPVAPTDIGISVTSVAESSPIGTVVGTVRVVDPNTGQPKTGDAFTYTLVSGSGSDDNPSFQIIGDQLRTNTDFDHAARKKYSIRVRSTGSTGLFFEEAFTIDVIRIAKGPPNLMDGLLARYGLDGDAKDSSGNGLDGTVNNATPAKDRFGRENRALSFNGLDSSVAIPHHASLNTLPLSISVWFQTTAVSGGLVGKYEASNWNGYQVSFQEATGAVWPWYVGPSRDVIGGYHAPGETNPNPRFESGPLNDGTWHHVVFTVDDSGGALFVDGALRATKAWRGQPAAVTNSLPLMIGEYLGATNGSFKGLIDDVAIYGRVLSPEEVSLLHKVDPTAPSQ